MVGCSFYVKILVLEERGERGGKVELEIVEKECLIGGVWKGKLKCGS